MMNAKLTGAKNLRTKFRVFGDRSGKALMVALRESAIMVKTSAQRGIQKGPKTGTVSKRGKKFHIASAPGEFPATDTGYLVSHISITENRRRTLVDIISKAPYSQALEFGTSRMKPRPFMAPALEANRKAIAKRTKAAVNKQIRRAGSGNG